MLTPDRTAELSTLQQLLQDTQKLNAASGTLDRLFSIQAAAAKVSAASLGTGRESFMTFMWNAVATPAGAWPQSRQTELKELVKLVDALWMLESSTGVLKTLRAAAETADKLLKADLDNGDPAFINFLADELRQAVPA